MRYYRYVKVQEDNDIWTLNSEQAFHSLQGARLSVKAYYRRYPNTTRLNAILEWFPAELPPYTISDGSHPLFPIPKDRG